MESYSKNVTLEIDIMYVNSLPFLVTISRHLKILIVHYLQTRKVKMIMASLDTVLNDYKMRGLPVKQIFADGEFDAIRTELSDPKRQVILNTTSKNEHVSNVEREIQTIKERCRACCASVNFDRFPRQLTKEMVSAMVFWINCIPQKDGVSETLSPRTILTGKHINVKDVKHKFGDFVQCQLIQNPPTQWRNEHSTQSFADQQ